MRIHSLKPFLAVSLALSFFLTPALYAETAGSNTVTVNRSEKTVLEPPAGKTELAGSEDPLKELDNIHKSFNKVVEEARRRVRNYQQAGKSFEPDADFIESNGQYVLSIDLPGMQKDQINVEATKSAIAISGERKTERQVGNPDKDGNYQYERSSGSFYRRVSLPGDANTAAISAKYENGVLQITIPKLNAGAPESQKVAVQ